MTVGDYDGDYDIDVAATDINLTVTVLRNNGNGVFGSLAAYGPGGFLLAQSMVSGDVDLDGDVDIATQNVSNDQAIVLLNDGSGAFSTWMRFGVGDAPLAVHWVDLDADADLDLITANQNEDSFSLLHNRRR